MNTSPAITDIVWDAPGYYPPPGFHPQGLFDCGNGDECGVYWPIGRESEPPLFCEMYHDLAEMVPLASTFAGLVRLKALEDADRADEDDEESSLLGEEAKSLSIQYDIELLPFDSSNTREDRLIADPHSPFVLLEAARDAFQEGDLNWTEQCLSKALALLPEYTDALEQMAALRRRQQNDAEAIRWALETISAPRCFGGGRDKCQRWLKWLQSLPDSRFPEYADDPLWANRHALKLDTGVKTSDDIPIFEDAIRAYLEQGQGVRAIRLRVRLGERMLQETTSFAARYGYNEACHRTLLRENLIAAGLETRLPVLGKE